MIYVSDHCYIDHQVSPSQDYWYIADIHDGYDAPQWPTREAMIVDLENALVSLKGLL